MKRLLMLAALAPRVAAATLALHLSAPSSVHVIFHRADGRADPVERVLQPGMSSVDLPNGTWRLEASANGLWHEPQYVTVPATAAVEVRMWPVATVFGEFEV